MGKQAPCRESHLDRGECLLLRHWRTLPTEAEWEYAARAGSKTSCYGDIDRVAWYDKEQWRPRLMRSLTKTKEPNAWELSDTLGNVSEWTADLYADKLPVAATDPTGPASGTQRMLRSGSAGNESSDVRVSKRIGEDPGSVPIVGIRCGGD